MRRMILAGLAAVMLSAGTALPGPAGAQAVEGPAPIVIGQSFKMDSAVMDAAREINVWLPPGYDAGDARYPVLYVLDGGLSQDFHHISGLAQLGTVVGTTRDVIVVGIASVDRRNELALPTDDADLIARYPTQGQSERFRRFVAEEVQPFIEGRFRASGETALMGESLAGLFVVETLLIEPELFDTYIAFDPSLWWNDGALVSQAGRLPEGLKGTRLFLAVSSDGDRADAVKGFVAALAGLKPARISLTFERMENETHATIYHPAALRAFRSLFSVSK